ncbi:hypothetical protein N8J89_12680 [Crossiella sp. CA-258035]|uniref:hypothetical protein n=1 Tax=Crossiella sp. CA-258035 TaxID=2981138 RepID=UPI0024BC96A4|nr:hypothetical protein [Crossiella sp. CA-258035]WHT21876.1 hypothetical protein N8J89_12680 [Crossiella sp. CA-258035]
MGSVVPYPASAPDRPPTPVGAPVTMPLVTVFGVIMGMGAWLHSLGHDLWWAFGTPLLVWGALFGSARVLGRLRTAAAAALASGGEQTP